MTLSRVLTTEEAPVWDRPDDWLDLPVVNVGDQKFVGLWAVYDNDSNHCSCIVNGNYTVDWGDGSAPQNVAAGVQADHNYVWTDLSSGTLTNEGFRQAIVTITPQAGQNLTVVNLYTRVAGSGNGACSGWLDIKMAGSLVTTFGLGTGVSTIIHRNLQHFEYVGPSSITAQTATFQQCTALKTITGTEWTALMTNLSSFFSGCLSLIEIPLLDTHSCSTFTSMFTGCASLREIPLLNTSAGTNFASMFSGCQQLEEIPLLDTHLSTTCANMFLNCTNLKIIPLLNTILCTNFSGMFNGCLSLKTVPVFNMAAATNVTTMFSNCASLAIVPAIALPATTGALTNMFAACTALGKILMTGIKNSINLPCRLSAAELDRVYTNLATVSGQTITVTGNPGTTGDTPSIAIAKGWTVTG